MSRSLEELEQLKVRLRGAAPAVLPSLLQCDFGNLEREVRLLEEAGVAALHLDVMDGFFVPNLTYGMPIVAAVRRLTTLPLDVHLMIDRPERYVEAFREAGADLLTVHCEAVESVPEVLGRIRAGGMAAGVAINPSTPLERLEAVVQGASEVCDLVLVMSVEAGFGGQSFQPVALERLRWLRSRLPAATLLEIDGGIKAGNIRECVEAGAELLVVGSAIFSADDYVSATRDLSTRAAGV